METPQLTAHDVFLIKMFVKLFMEFSCNKSYKNGELGRTYWL